MLTVHVRVTDTKPHALVVGTSENVIVAVPQLSVAIGAVNAGAAEPHAYVASAPWPESVGAVVS